MSSVRKGKAGELLVANELLRRDFDVYIPVADTGIDLVTVTDHKTFLIQVKESRAYDHEKFKRFWFHPKKSYFMKNSGDNIFYAFVLKEEHETHYMIIPSLFIVENLGKFDIDKKSQVHLYFDMYPDKVIEGRKSMLDFTEYFDDFSVFQ